METALITPDLQAENDRLQAQTLHMARALRRCVAELNGWMRAHGTDLDTQEAVVDANLVLRGCRALH